MKNGRGERVNPVHFSEDDRIDFIDSFLIDERASDEWKNVVKHLDYIIRSGDDECAFEAEEIYLNLEAIVAYETGAFRGNEYFSETYWDNYKLMFEWAEKRRA